jgi:UDP-4-amino-4,6-dideoxy-N-acetyl-beta-L-altrosamine transaminase/dTDP-4-dehydrorhamnose reductase
MSSLPKVVIIGASGLLGSNLLLTGRNKKFQLYGTSRKSKINCPYADCFELNCSDYRALSDFLEAIKPDWVIHCGGATNVDWCEKHPEETWQINVDATAHLATLLRRIKAGLIYISSDSVFDGKKGNYATTDAPNPINIYARSKFASEQIIRQILKQHVIIRTNFHGWNAVEKESLSEWIINNLKQGKTIPAFSDIFFNPLEASTLAGFIWDLLEEEAEGIFHLAASDSSSKYKFALSIAEVFGFSKEHIIPTESLSLPDRAARPPLTTLAPNFIKNIKMPAVLDGIKKLLELQKCGYREELKKIAAPESGDVASRKKTLSYGRHCIDEKDVAAVSKVLKSDFLTTGPAVEEFEKRLAEYIGAKHTIVVNSGTAALHCAYAALGLKAGDEVIVPTMTFAATANAAVYCGATPVFADVNADDMLIDEKDIIKHITPRTKAIAVVDYAGLPCNYGALREIARKHNLFLVADACHSLGASYENKPVGTLADLTCLSFHPVKLITTGEGGAIVTDNDEFAAFIRDFRSHGIVRDPEKFTALTLNNPAAKRPLSWYYEMQYLGFNYRLPDINCALGMSQLSKIDRFLNRRREIAEYYRREFAGAPFIKMQEFLHNRKSAWHLFVVQIDFDKIGSSRVDTMRRLKNNGILTQVHYVPVHKHPFYRNNFKTYDGMCPVAEGLYEKILSLPIYPAMKNEDAEYVAGNVKSLLKER